MPEFESSHDATKSFHPSVKRLAEVSQIDFELGFFASILRREPAFADVLRCQAELLSRKGLHEQALELDRRLILLRPVDSVIRYNLACSLASNGLLSESMSELRLAVELGYHDLEHLLSDPDLDALRDLPDYQALLRQLNLTVEAADEG